MKGAPRPGQRCPWCHKLNDAWAPETPGTEPKPGDVSICAYCARLAIFTARRARKPTRREVADLMKDPVVRRAVAHAKIIAHELRRQEGR